MKTKKFLSVVGVCSVMAGFSAQAAYIDSQLGQNPNSPYYADFHNQDLNVSYTSSNGKFTATSVIVNNANAYNAHSLSAGTHGLDNAASFSGSYTLTAYIKNVGGVWVVNSGTVDIYGNLPGVTASSSDLLLAANLQTGANSLGYSDTGTGTSSTIFEFLFNVTATDSQSHTASSLILQDFFGANFGHGGIILSTGGLQVGYTDLAHSFSNGTSGNGYADTFVPEPAAFSMAGSFMALIGCAFTRRAQIRKTLTV